MSRFNGEGEVIRVATERVLFGFEKVSEKFASTFRGGGGVSFKVNQRDNAGSWGYSDVVNTVVKLLVDCMRFFPSSVSEANSRFGKQTGDVFGTGSVVMRAIGQFERTNHSIGQVGKLGVIQNVAIA